MKKLFTEPELEILTFLCDGILVGDDSVEIDHNPDNGVEGEL